MKNRMLCSIVLSLLCSQSSAQTDISASLEQSPSLNTQQKQENLVCNPQIATEVTDIDESFILDWATKAALQSFHFTPEGIEVQLQQLQSCYTPQGWSELNKALYKSGNIELIKMQHLTVSSELDGPAQLIEAKEDQWKITLPLRVIYQNDQERMTHFLNVYFMVGRKLRGEPGIMQMIAIPRATPSFQKAGSLKEIVQGIYTLIAEKNTNTHHTLQEKLLTPLFSSLFPAPTRIVVGSTENKERASLAQLPPGDLEKILTNTAYKTITKAIEFDPAIFAHWLNQTVTQAPIFNISQKIQSWYAQMTIKNRTSEPSGKQKIIFSNWFNEAFKRSEREGAQWNISLPFNLAYQNNKGKIIQLVNIDLTLGCKISSNLRISNKVLLSQVAPIPSSATPLSNRAPSQLSTAVDCQYRIPAEIKYIDEATILSWAENAATQSFSFNAATIETELSKLQSCYTENGWHEFKTALDKSGNIEAIKTFHLMMNSRINGKIKLIEAQANQWKIKLPLKIHWQSDKENMTQLLNIDLTVGRKNNGDLGIMQIIATIDGSTSFVLKHFMHA